MCWLRGENTIFLVTKYILCRLQSDHSNAILPEHIIPNLLSLLPLQFCGYISVLTLVLLSIIPVLCCHICITLRRVHPQPTGCFCPSQACIQHTAHLEATCSFLAFHFWDPYHSPPKSFSSTFLLRLLLNVPFFSPASPHSSSCKGDYG